MADNLKDLGFQSLDDLGFVAQDQLEPSKPVATPGIGEALLRSGAQGLAFGGADEATAAIESMLTDKTYQQALEESRQKYKAAEEAHPIASFVGNVAGGALGAAGVGEVLGSLGLMGKLAGTAAEAPQALSALQKMGQAAKAGAGYGALTGLGTSEESLINKPVELAKDVASSAALGGVLGGGLAGLGHLGSKIAEESGFIKRPVDSFKLGTEGKLYLSKTDTGKIETASKRAATRVYDLLEDNVQNLKDFKDDIFKNAAKSGGSTDISNFLNSMKSKVEALGNTDIAKADKDRLLGLIENYKKDFGITSKSPFALGDETKIIESLPLSPGKLDQLRRDFQVYTAVGDDPLKTKEARNIALQTVNELESILRHSISDEDIQKSFMKFTNVSPEYFKTNKIDNSIIKSLNGKIHDLITVKDILGIPRTPNEAEKVVNIRKLSALFNRESSETSGGVSARQTLDDVYKILNRKTDDLQSKYSNLFVDPKVKNVFNSATKAGERVENLRYAAGKIGSGPASLLGLADVATMQGANLMGYTSRFGKYFYDADKQAFKKMSSAIKNSSGENVLTKAFDKLALTADDNKKRAMINTMMQSPVYRAMIHKFGESILPSSEEPTSGSPTE